MNRTGGIYLIFFITISVAVTSTYLLTRTHLGNRHATDKNLEFSKAQLLQTQTIQVFSEKIQAYKLVVEIKEIKELLIKVKYELLHIISFNIRAKELNAIIVSLKNNINKSKLAKKTINSADITELLKKASSQSSELIATREKFLVQNNQLLRLLGKINKLLIQSVNQENLTSLSRSQTLTTGKMLTETRRAESILKQLRLHIFGFNISKQSTDRLAKALVKLNSYNLALLTGDHKKNMSELRTRSVRLIQKSIRVHLDLLQKLAQRNSAVYAKLRYKIHLLTQMLNAIESEIEKLTVKIPN